MKSDSSNLPHVWARIPRPFLALAPMEDVTDTVFRRIVNGCGRPDISFTEFTSVDGLFSAGRASVIHRLQYTPGERPLVAQIWGNNPENYYRAGFLLNELGFDGIDINMGCPVPKIVKNGCCSALIDNKSLAQEIILAAKEGAGDLPVSVKTRIGNRSIQTEDWGEFLLSLSPAALIVHGRTARQMSKVPANWDEIAKVVEIRDRLGSDTCIVGNGDIQSREQALSAAEQYGVDGVMIGRGIFNDLFLFNPETPGSHLQSLSTHAKLQLLEAHIQLFENTWGENRRFGILKKFFKIYVSHFKGATELRTSLIMSETADEARAILADWRQLQLAA